MKITSIRLDRMRLPLDPPFHPAWDPVPRRHFDATLVTVETDEGLTGHGSVRIDPDGCLTVPDAPGLGARIDPEAVTRYALPA